jgi:prophage antirepressor-like protein
MKEMTLGEIYKYVDEAEEAFRQTVLSIVDEIIKDGGQFTPTKLKRLKKKAAFKFMNRIQREEKENAKQRTN